MLQFLPAQKSKVRAFLCCAELLCCISGAASKESTALLADPLQSLSRLPVPRCLQCAADRKHPLHACGWVLMCWIPLLNWGTKLWIFFSIHKLWQFFRIHSFPGLWHWIKNCLEQWYLQVFQFYEWCSFSGVGRGGTFMERWALWGSVRVTASNPLINLFH